MRYDPSLTIKEALDQFYLDNGFSPEDAKKNYYRMNIGPLVTYVYNPEERRKVIHLHDVEHVLYEVEPTFEGEAEISAISLVSRGKKPLANYLYGTLGVVMGLVINKRRTLKGLMRGMRRRSVFDFAASVDILNMKVGEWRQELGILI